jgi:hypothetical protein
MPLTGHVEAGARGGRILGQVTLSGRGFSLVAELDEQGRFRFPGIPDEEVRLAATGRIDGGGRFHGTAVRRTGSHVEVPVAQAVRIRGRLVSNRSLDIRSVEAVRADGLRIEGSADRSEFTLDLAPGSWMLDLVALDSVVGGWHRASARIDDVRSDRNDVVVYARTGD